MAQRINFAKTKSDPITKRDGTFKERPKVPKRKAPVQVPAEIKRAKAEVTAAAAAAEQQPMAMETTMADAAPPPAAPVAPQEPVKAPTGIPRPLKPMPPNSILIAEDLPQECNEAMLQILFQQ